MTVRFRIRTSQGQELSFATHEMFEEFVRSGDLAPNDLVYDGETHEWAPARTHPLVLQIEYEADEAAEAAPRPASTAGGGDRGSPADGGTAEAESAEADDEGLVPASDAGNSFGLELAPAAEGRTPEEEAAAFVKRMESERAMERDFGSTREPSSMQGIRMDDAQSFADLVGVRPEPDPPPKPPPPRRPEPTRSGRTKEQRGPARRPDPPRTRSQSTRPRGKPTRPKKKSAVPTVVLLIVALAAAAAAVYFGTDLLRPQPAPEEPVENAAGDPLPPPRPQPEPEPEPDPVDEPEPVIADTEEAVRERAQERFLGATQALLTDLPPIPDRWLSGDYFLLASEFADVRATWLLYRTTVRDVRAGDGARYRAAYASALDDAGVTAPDARARRLQAAIGSFATRAEEVDQHWGRVEALATAAVQSHDALVGAEGLILYDASGSTGRPAGIGAGTSGRDPDTAILLDQVVDLLGRALDADGRGPREGANVREWVWDGFLDVVTR